MLLLSAHWLRLGCNHDRSAGLSQSWSPDFCPVANARAGARLEVAHRALPRRGAGAFRALHGVRSARRPYKPVLRRGLTRRPDQHLLAARRDPHTDRSELTAYGMGA